MSLNSVYNIITNIIQTNTGIECRKYNNERERMGNGEDLPQVNLPFSWVEIGQGTSPQMLMGGSVQYELDINIHYQVDTTNLITSAEKIDIINNAYQFFSSLKNIQFGLPLSSASLTINGAITDDFSAGNTAWFTCNFIMLYNDTTFANGFIPTLPDVVPSNNIILT